jgi:hypothetical protein
MGHASMSTTNLYLHHVMTRDQSRGHVRICPAQEPIHVGGAKGIRTPDLLVANETRYQLRHSPADRPGRSARRLYHRLEPDPDLSGGPPPLRCRYSDVAASAGAAESERRQLSDEKRAGRAVRGVPETTRTLRSGSSPRRPRRLPQPGSREHRPLPGPGVGSRSCLQVRTGRSCALYAGPVAWTHRWER